MTQLLSDHFNARATLPGTDYAYYRLDKLAELRGDRSAAFLCPCPTGGSAAHLRWLPGNA